MVSVGGGEGLKGGTLRFFLQQSLFFISFVPLLSTPPLKGRTARMAAICASAACGEIPK